MEIVASGSSDERVKIWDIISGENIITLTEHTEVVLCVCFSRCGRFLASCSRDRTIILWDCSSWSKLQRFIGHTGPVTSVSFNSSGDSLVSSSTDCSVRVWSVESNTETMQFKIDSDKKIFSAVFSHISDTIGFVVASRAFKYYICLNDSRTGALLRQFPDNMHFNIVRSIQFSRDDSLILTASDDQTAIVTDVESGNILCRLIGHTKIIFRACFDSTASRVVTASADNTARIWDVATGECTLVLSAFTGFVNSACFSEDGIKVITGSERLVQVWDSYTGEELMTLSSHFYSVRSVSYQSTQGSYI